jgi:hypothetical protein
MDALAFLENLEIKMVRVSEEKPVNTYDNAQSEIKSENRFEIQNILLASPFNKAPARELLLQGSSQRQELDNVLAGYLDYAASLTPDKGSGKIRGLLDPSLYLPGGTSDQTDLTLMSALHTMDVLKNNVLAVESYMLTCIVNH